MLILPQQLQNDIEQYAQKVQDFTNGIISETEFKVFRVPMGVYEQRKNGTYMVRVRCVAGYITPKLLQVVCDIAEKYGSKLLHITTRQEFQIQNISLENSVHIISELYQYGLTTRGGGGNTVRNIMASVDSGIAKDEIFDVFPYAVNLTNFLISQPSSWALPRKYKISFSNSSKDTGYAIFNDLGFIAKQQDSTQGFAVYVGGSLSSQPMIGELLFNFIPSSDIYTVAEAVKQVFNKYGNRRNKHKARLRFIFYKYGTEQVLNWIRTAYNELKTIETSYLFEPITLSKQTDFDKNIYTDNSDSNFILWKKRYVTQQKQKGYVSFEIPCKYGNFSPSTLRDLAKYFEPYGDDIIRFSMRQTIFVRNIPEIHIYEIISNREKIKITD
ncbi:MAG: Sulfite reductase (ferredoxin) [Bacteroidetes bacterium ADurb.Bin217]|nr:MAG: Sulfite reductase (ferredoxin) [Bacteroidetes bacterium ADurb.Bin217]